MRRAESTIDVVRVRCNLPLFGFHVGKRISLGQAMPALPALWQCCFALAIVGARNKARGDLEAEAVCSVGPALLFSP